MTTSHTLTWYKSNYSADQTACVEAAGQKAGIAVRDTQNRERRYLTFPSVEWAGLLGALKNL